ncbi:YjgF-like protein [Thozetella sp. PMI_491]|nr:YjgF-like protein [Thozetella sp. PMI_491]
MAAPKSKLEQHGFRFVNWPGGEQPAEMFGISHAVIVPPNAKTVVVGGQLGIRLDGTIPTSLEEEVVEAFDHVERALKACGLGEDAWEYVYKASIKTFEVNDGVKAADVVIPTARKYLKNTKPTWTGVEVKGLAFPGLHIEITVEAFLPN